MRTQIAHSTLCREVAVSGKVLVSRLPESAKPWVQPYTHIVNAVIPFTWLFTEPHFQSESRDIWRASQVLLIAHLLDRLRDIIGTVYENVDDAISQHAQIRNEKSRQLQTGSVPLIATSE